MKLWANHNFELPKAKSNVHCHVFLFGLWCTSCFCILLARCHARRGFFCKIFTSFINFIIYKIRLRSTPSRSPNIYPHFSPSWYIYNHTDPSSNLIMYIHLICLYLLVHDRPQWLLLELPIFYMNLVTHTCFSFFVCYCFHSHSYCKYFNFN